MKHEKRLLKETDWATLEEKISLTLGCIIKLQTRIKKCGSDEIISVTTDSLLEKVGVFKSVMKRIDLETRQICYSEEEVLYIRFNLDWDYKVGGHNGHELISCWYYYDTKKWEFQSNN